MLSVSGCTNGIETRIVCIEVPSDPVQATDEVLSAAEQLSSKPQCDLNCQQAIVSAEFPETERVLLDVIEHNDRCIRIQE